MCRLRNDDTTAVEIDDLLAVPAPALEDLFADPDVRKWVGEWISQAMERPGRRRRGQKRPRRATPRS